MLSRCTLALTGIALLLALSGSAVAQLTDFRSINGYGNNVANPEWGSVGVRLLRKAPAAYPGDGSGETIITPPERANPREISNVVVSQEGDLPNNRRLSDMVWQWGQFVDHDIDLTGTDAANGTADISVADDDILGPGPIPFSRSNFDPQTGTDGGNPRQQINEITAFIDASNVYGSDEETAHRLRAAKGKHGKGTSKGQGVGARLRSSADGKLLPTGKDGSFLSGDIRVNEQIALTVMHTLFMREHNRLVGLIQEQDPSLDDEQVYQLARKIVGAEIQKITYEEFLPALLGWQAPSPWSAGRYDPELNPSIASEFSTAFYRFGHSMLSANLLLVDEDGNREPLPLRDAFFNPAILQDDPSRVENILRGLTRQPAQEVDIKLVDDVRNFLFGPPGAGGLDLASLNIQRGRDHGMPDYNTLREAYGLRRVTGFAQINSDPEVRHALESVYDDIDNVDPWVGGLAEGHTRRGSSVGLLVGVALREQFIRLRDGDRFFWRRDPDLRSDLVRNVIDLWSLRLSDVIRLNTDIDDIPADVFRVPEE